MKNSINLLPKDVRQSSDATYTYQTMQRITLLAIILTLLVVGVGAGLILNQRSTIEKLGENRTEILANLGTYSQVEQQLVLLKDRTLGIEELLAESENKQTFMLHKKLYELMPLGLSFSRETVGDTENLFTFRSGSAAILKNYIDIVSSDPTFRHVEINQLTYNPIFGYQVELFVQ